MVLNAVIAATLSMMLAGHHGIFSRPSLLPGRAGDLAMSAMEESEPAKLPEKLGNLCVPLPTVVLRHL